MLPEFGLTLLPQDTLVCTALTPLQCRDKEDAILSNLIGLMATYCFSEAHEGYEGCLKINDSFCSLDSHAVSEGFTNFHPPGKSLIPLYKFVK